MGLEMFDVTKIVGYTMAAYDVGVSLVVALPNTNVVSRQILNYTGGTLHILGNTGAVGVAIPSASTAYEIWGGGRLFISSRGATATANIVSYLSAPQGTTLAP